MFHVKLFGKGSRRAGRMFHVKHSKCIIVYNCFPYILWFFLPERSSNYKKKKINFFVKKSLLFQ